ncbi:glycerol-3-phosphate dehydrogenase/oxidase [Glycomyces albidus]|jgi:glycerol-3-phosphate dehydrogenase|uniref:Glycerol-3-phosphate dehydrogenase n=1 Tax=Glycomyces albidus TaxID=2656774 RepID=A0A6L5GCA3_9ACTN|nr:glycerol-3-phosphate dehydrogenase/oxidase [Glycomyces albidus]MQM27268.1 FAD-dependent oxidoreductase [Glycomyces albidus]
MRTPVSWTRSQAGRLSPERRRADLRRLGAEEFDVVVVGGGATGAGAALDAASRGLRTALVEARDLASGTSSRSSKLVHGGLRYLEQLELGLVHEALTERGLLAGSLAPHLVRPVPFLLPLKGIWERAYYGAGVAAYDVLATALRSRSAGAGRDRGGLPWHRHLSRTAALRAFPDLDPRVRGAIRYFDAQVDDARLVVALARTAASLGAAVVTSAQAVGFTREGGRLSGVEVLDVESGTRRTVKARTVVCAAGVWSDDLAGMLPKRPGMAVKASKGVHLVLPGSAIRGSAGIISRTKWSVLFIIPWDRHWLIGTTDTEWDLDLAHPAASASDVAYLLQQASDVLRHRLDVSQVEGVYAGLRPLLRGETEATSKLSREHAVTEPEPGLFFVAGGKLTTYRVMARDAVDAAAARLGPGVPASGTHLLPLLGADGYGVYWEARDRIAKRFDVPVETVEHLLRRYGNLAPQLLRMVAELPQLGRPLAGGDDYLRAEVVYAARYEGALHLDDILTRRLRLSIESFDRGTEAASDAAALAGAVLDWQESRRTLEVETYLHRVDAERRSQQQPDDDAAEAARLAAVDLRRLARFRQIG